MFSLGSKEFEIEMIIENEEQSLLSPAVQDIPSKDILELIKKDEFLEIFDNLDMTARIGIIRALEKIEDPDDSRDPDDYEMFTRALFGHIE